MQTGARGLPTRSRGRRTKSRLAGIGFNGCNGGINGKVLKIVVKWDCIMIIKEVIVVILMKVTHVDRTSAFGDSDSLVMSSGSGQEEADILIKGQ